MRRWNFESLNFDAESAWGSRVYYTNTKIQVDVVLNRSQEGRPDLNRKKQSLNTNDCYHNSYMRELTVRAKLREGVTIYIIDRWNYPCRL